MSFTINPKNPGMLLSEAIQQSGIPFGLPCSRGTCGKCKVRIIDGKVTEISDAEKKLLTIDEIEKGYRLACYTRIYSSVVIDTINKKSNILSTGRYKSPTFNPIIKRNEYAVAIDIGTTTIVINLFHGDSSQIVNSVSAINEQRSFGADIISRIDYSISHSHGMVHNVIISQINKLINILCKESCVENGDIKYAIVTGNTAMLYFFSNLNPKAIAFYPFSVQSLFGCFMGNNFGLNMASDGKIYIPPCISAHIGADLVCAILASPMLDNGTTSLLVDMGTNGEIALYNEGIVKCCSTAAGPAFEGVGLSCGSTAVEGAICSVKYDMKTSTIKVKTINDGLPVSICGSGIIDAISVFLSLGIIDITGRFLKEGHGFEKNLQIIDDQLSFKFDDGSVYITQKDIRQIQLAKGAIAGGIETVILEAGLDVNDIDDFYICGGFGTFLNIKSASNIGLIPCGINDKVVVLGNAALQGASLIILDNKNIKECEKIAKMCKYTELADSPIFKEKYLKGMSF